MPDSPLGYQRFFAELKRRHVFRVMAVYGVVGFILLQVVDLAVPALLLPDWTYRLVAFLLLLGFPVAIGLAWAFETTPEGVRRHQKADPAELRAIISAPASRRWPAGLLALGGMALVVWAAWHAGRSSMAGASGASDARVDAAQTVASAGDPVTSIAVLPFVNMSSDPEQEYFSDGISEELLNLLAHVPELQVAARTSSFAFKGQDVGIPEIADQLGVAHVLEGSVRKAGDRVRITAQLIRAEDGFHLWSDTWDRTLEDIFAVQDEIASDVARELEVRLLGARPAAEGNPEAYNLVLQARHLTRLGTDEGIRRAGDLYEQAIAIDSSYVPAWTGLARNFYDHGRFGSLDNQTSGTRATETAHRALQLDPRAAEAYAVLGNVAAFNENDPKRAAEHYERALELDPTNYEVLEAVAALLRDIERYEESSALIDYLIARDPVNPSAHARRANLLRSAGRHDEAIEAQRMVLTLSPAASMAHYGIALSQLLKGEPEAALRTIALEPDDEFRVKITAMAHHALGNRAEHEATFRQLRERWGAVWPSEIAQVYAFKGDADSTFIWLDRAVAQNEDGLDQQHGYGFYDPIRDDPRWHAFLERTGTSPDQLAAIEFEVDLPE